MIQEIYIKSPSDLYQIYSITNLLNKKRYIGSHIFKGKYDNYMGSGKLILLSLKKYGKDKFKKEIL